jgi:hypothetical protein
MAVSYRQYQDEEGVCASCSVSACSLSQAYADLVRVMALVDVELSEPYSVFTYRYFINNWQRLCFLVRRALAVRPPSRD